MTARTLLTTAALFGLAGSSFAQDTPAPTPTQQPATVDPTTARADQPSAGTASPTTPQAGTPTQPTPATTAPTPATVGGSGMVYPNQGLVYPGGVVQPGYSQPMSYYPQTQMGYPQGQIMPAGYTAQPTTYAQPGVVTYGTPVMAGTTYAYPTTGYTTVGGYTPMYTTSGSTGYAYPSFANGYANMGTTASNGGFISNVVSYPGKVTRRLFRR